MEITPLGVFALTATAAGTLDGNDVIRLRVYFVAYIGCCSFLIFVAFPLMMSVITPFSCQEVLTVSRNALITAFTIANISRYTFSVFYLQPHLAVPRPE